MLKRIQGRCHPKTRVYQIYPLTGHGYARPCWPVTPGNFSGSAPGSDSFECLAFTLGAPRETDPYRHRPIYSSNNDSSAIAEIHAGDFAELDTDLQCQDEAISWPFCPVGFAQITKQANRLTPGEIRVVQQQSINQSINQ